MTAADATGVIMRADDPRGYEVLIPRKIQPPELRHTRNAPQVIGWRYWPGAHGREPCGCEVCQRGTFKAAQLRDRDDDVRPRRRMRDPGPGTSPPVALFLGLVVTGDGDGDGGGTLVIAGIVVLVVLPIVVGLVWRFLDRRKQQSKPHL
jgi:hypothetical protein